MAGNGRSCVPAKADRRGTCMEGKSRNSHLGCDTTARVSQWTSPTGVFMLRRFAACPVRGHLSKSEPPHIVESGWVLGGKRGRVRTDGQFRRRQLLQGHFEDQHTEDLPQRTRNPRPRMLGKFTFVQRPEVGSFACIRQNLFSGVLCRCKTGSCKFG